MVEGKKILIKDPQKNLKIERLKALGATTFVGTIDPLDAKIWMDMLEKCFDVMGCPEDRKVRLATFLLQEGASDWWKSVRSKHSESEIIRWSEFKKAFYEKYYVQPYRDAKRSEFLKLVQGPMTVVEYEKKYVELLKYATTIIKDEADKCKRFEDGLREEIRTSTTTLELREFRKLVEAALKVERNISERKSQKEPSRNVCDFSTNTISTSRGIQFTDEFTDDTEFMSEVARYGTSKPKLYEKSSSKTDSSNTKKYVTGSPISSIRPTSERRESTFSHDRYSQCQSCGKICQGKCLKETNSCYNCGQSSHMKGEYPLLMQKGNILQGSLSQPEQSNVQVGQGQYMVQARSTMKDSEGQSSNVTSLSEPKSKGQFGTPRTHGKVFAMTQPHVQKLSK